MIDVLALGLLFILVGWPYFFGQRSAPGATCPRCREVTGPGSRYCWVCEAPLARVVETRPPPEPWTAERVTVRVVKVVAIGIGLLILFAALLFVTCFIRLSSSSHPFG
jgi:hypothetical protein